MKKKINSLSLKKNVISKLGSQSVKGGAKTDYPFPKSLRGCGDNMTRRCHGPISGPHDDHQTNDSCESVHIHCF